MSVTVGDIARRLEEWAPRGTAMSWDNVGLQVGRSERAVSSVLVALDLTPGVIEEARTTGADLIVTHHPAIFSPLRSVTGGGLVPSMVLDLAESGIAHYAIHTNLDAARGGVSFVLADRLGLQDVGFLSRDSDASLRKLVVYVPPANLEAVREALAGCGAGRIGSYRDCAYASDGHEYFRASKDSSPARGTGKELSRLVGFRLEADVPAWLVDTAVRAVREVHPYEEPAIDVYTMQTTDTQVGIGAVGVLPKAVRLSEFMTEAATALGADSLRYVGDPDATVRRIAVCGGSGSPFIRGALAAGADVYVTGDMKYHQWFDVLAPDGRPRMAIVDAGHYETEAPIEETLVAFLSGHVPDVSVRRTTQRTGPVRSWPPRGT